MFEIATTQQTMSSREIAELTSKDASHIHRDIRSMLDELKDDPELDHVREDKDARGYTACFHLPKGLTMTLVAGYNVKLRKAIIDRWQELEAQLADKAPAIPKSFAQALRLAADLEEQKAQVEAKLAIAEPKAIALDRFANHEGKHNLRNAAKVLGVPERKLCAWLLANRWYYRDHSGRLCAYAERIASGHLDTLPVEIQRTEGIQVVPQPVVTQRGMARLGELFATAQAI